MGRPAGNVRKGSSADTHCCDVRLPPKALCGSATPVNQPVDFGNPSTPKFCSLSPPAVYLPIAKFTFLVHSHMLRHACGYALANQGHDTRAMASSGRGLLRQLLISRMI